MRKLLVLLLLVPILGWAQSSFDGTWKIDLNQVKAPDKPEIFVLEKDMYHCKSCVPPISIKADGQEQKVTGHPYMDTLAVKVVDDHQVQQSWMKNGKPAGTANYVLAADGKTMNVDWVDTSQPSGKPISGKTTLTRVSEGPKGAHLVSGSWKTEKFTDITEEGLLVSYKQTADGLSMSMPTGQSYTAGFDGKEVPYVGDPGITTVSLKKLSDNSFEETQKRDGKVTTVAKITREGDKLKYEINDKLHGTTMQFTANKAVAAEAEK